MVRKLLAIAFILVLVLPPVTSTAIYLYSDQGDMPLYEAISEKEKVAPGGDGDIILALDLNYGFLNESMREKALALLSEAKAGRTVIVGLNTLRTLENDRPGILGVLGLTINFTKTGLVKISPNDHLKFTSFTYDSDTYGIALVGGKAKPVLLSGDIPVVSELRVGEGRFVIIAINPSALYLDTKNPAVAEFVVAIIRHYKGGVPLTSVAIGALASAGAVAYALNSHNPRIQRFREFLVGLVLALGAYMLPAREILKNEVRRGIYEYVKAKGYTTVNDVASMFSISRTNAKWHLSVLKRSGYVDETEVGNTMIFYPAGKRREAIKASLLENRTRREILKMVKEGKSLSEISRVLGLSKSTVHYNLSILEEYGLIKSREDGSYEVAEDT
ncbi:helix-turn-helix domain-containing protein [Thermococcus waiotapuensis]|uniref:Helix-turn-helix domain-containing protein n=1 Tax=Thermococcus waiotapuensis TaxID=90909 RepID=A0AAE4NVE5_9EURY|nr:helix-turn-helix domain-containing protein [Thermococcus waiotapuensis]MDV3103962.1 helix-turn-helix domain-containing protein [Thermococcus waiotapuensis]